MGTTKEEEESFNTTAVGGMSLALSESFMSLAAAMSTLWMNAVRQQDEHASINMKHLLDYQAGNKNRPVFNSILETAVGLPNPTPSDDVSQIVAILRQELAILREEVRESQEAQQNMNKMMDIMEGRPVVT